jgi:membrane associated rhomboid family serine protease
MIEIIKKKLKFVLIALGILYATFFLDFILPFDLNSLGIKPRTVSGLLGIIFAPVLHANLFHLISNTFPFVLLLMTIIVFYEKKWLQVVLFVIVVGGLLVWLFGRSANHVGASGLIYGLVGFLVTHGFLEKKFKSLLISLVIAFLYGGLIFGVFPTRIWISWESHLFGAIAGILISFLMNK